jgi:phytol kinase
MLTLVAIAVVFLILLLAEYLSRYKGVHSELTRKLVHTAVGAFVAFWPFFLTWRQIQFLAIAFLVVVLVSIKLDIFGSIHAVKRNSMGEVLFAVVIGLLAFIVDDKWIFTVAMLHMSLADGFAAVAGLAWGDSNKYKIMGRTKSIVGNLTFFFTSVIIMIIYAAFSGNAYNAYTNVLLPVIATFAETVSGEGMDNLVVPLLVALFLSSAG